VLIASAKTIVLSARYKMQINPTLDLLRRCQRWDILLNLAGRRKSRKITRRKMVKRLAHKVHNISIKYKESITKALHFKDRL
jgi:hypothetical protein